jgi:hypothetical protein
MKTIFPRLFHFQISRIAAMSLIALAWSIPAFCGEIHEAVKKGELTKIKALLKTNPNLVHSKDESDRRVAVQKRILGAG